MPKRIVSPLSGFGSPFGRRVRARFSEWFLASGFWDNDGRWLDAVAWPLLDTPAPAFDPDALAYIAAVETADGEPLEAGVREAINGFVVGCKADGIWDALKASCILAGARTLNGALVPLKGAAPTNFNFVSADYNRTTGLKGDGATKYLNSNRNNNADPQNSSHLSVFSSEIGDGNRIAIGNNTASGGSQILISTDFKLSLRLKGETFVGTESTLQIEEGLTGASRNTSTEVNFRSGQISGSASNTSVTPSLGDIWLFWRSSETGLHSNARLSFYSIGEAIDLAALDTRVSALITALDGALP